MAELPGLTSGFVIVALRAECGVIDKKRRLMPVFFALENLFNTAVAQLPARIGMPIWQ